MKQKGYQVIGLSCYVNGADINLMGMIDVFEWANIFRYFDLCITDRFHATIFSIRHGIPFITIDNETHYQEYESKTSFLLHSAGLEEHHINMIRKGWGEFEERIERIKRTEETRKKLIQKFGELKDKCMNSFIKVVENL